MATLHPAVPLALAALLLAAAACAPGTAVSAPPAAPQPPLIGISSVAQTAFTDDDDVFARIVIGSRIDCALVRPDTTRARAFAPPCAEVQTTGWTLAPRATSPGPVSLAMLTAAPPACA